MSRSTREDDERLLSWVGLRAAGWSAAQVARHVGLTRERVQIATLRVRDADIAESGEPIGEVARFYW